jgi:hypothetical protein
MEPRSLLLRGNLPNFLKIEKIGIKSAVFMALFVSKKVSSAVCLNAVHVIRLSSQK